MKYRVYWNNVCLISKFEKQHIESLRDENLPFDFTFYGLGQASALSAQVDMENANGECGADIVVSTDVDIFHNPNRSHYFSQYKKVPGELPQVQWLDCVKHPQHLFKPFLAIPLVFVTKSETHVTSLKELIDGEGKITYAFGGLHNSAGQSLLKAIWWLYGFEAARRFLKHAKVGSMPAHAYQMLSKGEVEVAIVPSLFALRSGVNHLKSVVPSEGAIAIPSYIAVKNNVPDDVYALFEEKVLSERFQNDLFTAGDVHVLALAERFDVPMLMPPWSFLESIDYHASFGVR